MYPRLRYTLFALLVTCFAPTLFAQVPQVISFQGVLSDGDGTPLGDGTHQVVFRLYDAATDGDAIWTETQQLSVSSGIFSVLLGSEAALDLPFDRPYWLGVTVGSDAELVPRAPLAAAPYSLGGRSTVAEWKAGESLVVRDPDGNSVHMLGADGTFEHAGGGMMSGRLDISVSAPEDTGLRAVVDGSSGSTGTRTTGAAVVGIGQTGVLGVGEIGVIGAGISENAVGVSAEGGITGLQATSSRMKGAAAVRSIGHLHVTEGGHVVLDDVDQDPTAFRFLVWSNDDTVRWRPLPEEEEEIFIRVPGGFIATQSGIQIRTDDDQVVFQTNIVGETMQSGSATIGDGVILTGGGITFADGTMQSTASAGGGGGTFDGTLNNQSLTIFGPDGEVAVQMTPQGTVDLSSIFFPGNSSLSGDGLFFGDGPSVTPGGITFDGGPSLDSGGLFFGDGPSVTPGGVSFEGGPSLTPDGLGFPGGPSVGTGGVIFADGPSMTPDGFGFPGGPSLGPGGVSIPDGPFVSPDGIGFPSGPIFGPNGVDFPGGPSLGPNGLDFPGGPSLGPDGFSFPGPTGDILINEDGFSVRGPDGSYRSHMNPSGDAFFPGHVTVGSISKQSGSFKIDHPLDPENKYLYHSFVESPDMLNVYNGNAALDSDGEVWVEMPEWFEALNQDYRYQLTPIGAPGPDLFIANEMEGNRFKIGGGEAGMKVSWQVTGVRRDRYAEENRIQVEVEKPASERGTLLYQTEGGAR